MMRGRFLLFLLFLGTVLGGWLWAQDLASPAPQSAMPAEPPTAVHALGRLEPAGTVLDVGIPAGSDRSCVAVLNVQEGQRVEAGQVLAHMDTYAAQAARLAEAERRVDVARARWRQSAAPAKAAEREAARAEVQRWSHRVDAAQRTHARMVTLRTEGIVATADADDAHSALVDAREARHRARAHLATLDEVRRVDLDLRQAEIAVAESVAAAARAELEATRVRAPQSGTVLRIHARPGERPGEDGLLALADIDRMQAVAEIFEGDIGRIAAGQTARVALFSTDATFEGRVAAVGALVGRKDVLANDPVSDTDARVIEVRIDLDAASSAVLRRLSNARVTVHIETPAHREPGAGR
ncbi:MAG: HlyD family efflux transporter periplasmic adaptor subunit [Acidobacteriota bacterium]